MRSTGISGPTVTRAVQTLHDLYREIPERMTVDSLRLDELSYSDSDDPETGAPVVRFRFFFEIPPAPLPARKD